MSWQMAMMAGVSAAQAIVGGIRGAQAAQTQGELGALGAKVRASQFDNAAAQVGIEKEEVGIETAQQEMLRRAELLRLSNANAIDMVGRGLVSTGQDSAAAIERANTEAAEADIHNIRLMGESKLRKLSFRQSNLEFAAAGQHAGALLAGAAAARGTQDALLNAGFKLAGTAIGSFGSMGGGGTSTDETMRTAIPKDKWDEYGVS